MLNFLTIGLILSVSLPIFAMDFNPACNEIQDFISFNNELDKVEKHGEECRAKNEGMKILENELQEIVSDFHLKIEEYKKNLEVATPKKIDQMQLSDIDGLWESVNVAFRRAQLVFDEGTVTDSCEAIKDGENVLDLYSNDSDSAIQFGEIRSICSASNQFNKLKPVDMYVDIKGNIRFMFDMQEYKNGFYEEIFVKKTGLSDQQGRYKPISIAEVLSTPQEISISSTDGVLFGSNQTIVQTYSFYCEEFSISKSKRFEMLYDKLGSQFPGCFTRKERYDRIRGVYRDSESAIANSEKKANGFQQ